jgi:hypothetical protein
MSVLFVFNPRKDSNTGHEIVDGGVKDNYPVWIFMIKGGAYVNNTDADLARPKIAFRLDSSKAPGPGGCPAGPDTSSSSPGTSDFMEQDLINRAHNVISTYMEGSAFGKAIISAYQGSFRLYEIVIPLQGYDWLRFNIDAARFNGMCCNGWEAANDVIRNSNLNPGISTLGSLAKQNPYKVTKFVST